MLLTHSPQRSRGIEKRGGSGKERQKQKDPYGKSEISQDKSPLLNSCHDSLDNNLHYPAPKTHLKACTIPLPSDSTGWEVCDCIQATPLSHHSPDATERLCVGLDFPSLEHGLENTTMHPISMWNAKQR